MLEQKEVELISHPFFDACMPKLHYRQVCISPVNTASKTELSSCAFTNVLVSLTSCGKKALAETFAEALTAISALAQTCGTACWFVAGFCFTQSPASVVSALNRLLSFWSTLVNSLVLTAVETPSQGAY